MSRSITVILAALLCASLAGATEPAKTPTESPAPGTENPAPVVLSPLMAEIHQVLDQERADVDALVAELQHTADPAERTALQRRIATVKKTAEVEMLRVQLRFAQEAGKAEAVARLEHSIEQILNPELRRAPVAAADGTTESGR